MAAKPKAAARKRTNAPTPPPITESNDQPGATAAVETAQVLQAPPEPKGKLGALILLLRRPEGAQIAELMATTGWQAHSVRGAIAGALKKKLGLIISSEKTEAGRTYRIVAAGSEA